MYLFKYIHIDIDIYQIDIDIDIYQIGIRSNDKLSYFS